MVETRTGLETNPYSQDKQEKMAALVRENRERKEREKQAKLRATADEQAAKMKRLEEEMKKVQQEEEERRKAAEAEAAAEEEKERMRIESGEGSSGGTMTRETDTGLEKRISEWVAYLSLGEDEEAESYVTKDEKAALAAELAAMTDPMERREREDEQKLAWKLRMKREKKRRREEVNKMTAAVAKVQECRAEVLAQPDDKAKWDKVLGYLEVLSKAWMEERQASWSQVVALSAMRSGFRDFAREIVTHIGGEVKHLRDDVGKFCEGAIQGAKAVAAVEGEARPRKDPVKLKFPDAYGGKKEENFDNWEASVNSYIYLQHILVEEQVLVAFQALKDEAASFARSLARTAGGGWVELRGEQEVRRQAWVIAKVKVEGGHASGRANGVVIGNLGSGEQLIPIVLVGMTILPQDSLESIVHLLGLSVGLWMECSAVPERGSVGIEELFPELGEEAGVTIIDDILGEAVVSGDMVEEENGNVFGVVRGGTWDEVSTFGQAANNDVDAVMPAVGFDVSKEGRPMEITGDGIKGFLETKVASALGVVVHDQELGAEATGVRDAESAGAFGFNVEKVVVEGVAEDGVEVTEFVIDGGEVGAREVSLGVVMVEQWQELDVGHGGVDFLKGLVIRAAGEGIRNTVAFVGGVANGKEFLVVENGENLAKMIKVGLEGGAKNKDVVEVDHDTNFVEVVKDVVHGGLECGRGVSETERHYEKLVVPEAGAEGGFVGVLLTDADLVEATVEVDLGEVFGSTKAIKKFGYPGKRILVLDRDPVQGAVVRAHAEFPGAVLLDEETTGTEGGGANPFSRSSLSWRFISSASGTESWYGGRQGGEWPGSGSMVWETPRSGGSLAGKDSGNTSLNSDRRAEI
ncbi:hypothetical protein CBR_g34267 [Chara braunii]|uniref:Uncharacterized protein n=1 Tax=Chara braunii TaxID=69332 RepID=A0A388JYP7_CHABU|nr:hypothetical protein CBR_g34267 [Chara braunii]|eukprot:GBG62895.1 hypothetical protein CBR_g34267 [Chara braunii]